jgi:hypothetical protein
MMVLVPATAAQGRYRRQKTEIRRQTTACWVWILKLVLNNRLGELRTTGFKNDKTTPPLIASLKELPSEMQP